MSRLRTDEDTWIWGNHRGGGGAPVKDTSGSVVSNLRTVIRGSVEVDSTSPNERKFRTHEDDRYSSRQDGRNLSRNELIEDNYDRDRRRDVDERDYYLRDPDNGRRRNEGQNTIQNSPKKIMSALRDMNSSVDEREAKLRKEQDYQALLRQQIEEKKREKELEKRKYQDEKAKELQDFRQQRDPPAIGRRNVAEFDSEQETRRFDARDQTSNRQKTRSDEYHEIDYNDSPHREINRGRGPVDSGRQDRRPRVEEVEESRNMTRSKGVREEMVSKIEYDELSALCNRLMDQQEDLKIEIDKQSKLIRDLRLESDRGSKPLERAKSMQQSRPAIRSTAGRPTSTRAQASADVASSPKKRVAKIPPKLAFGNPIQTGQEKKKTEMKGQLMQSVDRRSDADPRRRDTSVQKPVRSKVDFLEAPSNGFAKLQHVAKAAPIVVTYEDESQTSGKGRGRAISSMELQSESEYLHIGKSGGDVIGGDQLDRLLVQARRARVA